MIQSSHGEVFLNITDTTPAAKTIAAYSGACTAAQLDDQTAIQRASQELLTKIGVKLTASAISELGRTNSQQVTSQTALAQGIAAQKRGTVVEALSFYIQASNYDASLSEAASRMNVLSSNISSGNVGDDTRNDIQWRKDWVARLQEAETLFANYVKDQPYYLAYSTDIQWGAVDYQKETRAASVKMSLIPEASWAQPINEVVKAVSSGLQATKRAGTWGLNWPAKTIGTPSPFASQSKNYTVVVEIVNDKGVSIGRQTVSAPYGFDVKDSQITAQKRWEGTVSFPAVSANQITDKLTIRISSIDGLAAETASKQKKLSIMSQPQYNKMLSDIAAAKAAAEAVRKQAEAERAAAEKEAGRFTVSGGTITGYNGWGEGTGIVIPSVVNGQTITAIGASAFNGDWKDNTKLISVVIPDTVTSIGKYAFYRNRLNKVTFGNSVTRIEEYAFEGNYLTNIVIPDSVTFIGVLAFHNYSSSFTITIGANVEVEEVFFAGTRKVKWNFAQLYNKNKKQAGTYTYDEKKKKWSYKPLPK